MALHRGTTNESGQRQHLIDWLDRLDKYLRNFASTSTDSTQQITSLKARLTEIQGHLQAYDSVPERLLTLTYRELFERHNWRGFHPEGLTPLIEDVRLLLLGAKSAVSLDGEQGSSTTIYDVQPN